MSSALRELIAFFGVEVDDKKLDHAGEKMEGLASLAERVGATIGLAFGLHEIGEFIKGQVEVGAELLHTSEILGLSIGNLQAFQYAAANAGLGADEANTALRFLNKNLGEAATKGGDAAQAFQKLGVKIKGANGQTRPTQDILADVADGIRKLPGPAEKTAKAMEIFGRAGARMIPLLNKGSKGIDEFYREFEKLGGGIDEEFVEAAEEGEHQMNKLNLAFKGAKATIASALLPAFTWAVSSVTDVVTWFRELSKHSYIVQTALASLAVIVGILAVVWAALNFEVFLVLLAVALLVLAVDDIYTAFAGGKSVIGDFIDSILGIGATKEIVEVVRAVFRQFTDDMHDLWFATKLLINALGGLDEQTEPTKAGLDGVKSIIAGLGEVAHLTTNGVLLLVKAMVKVLDLFAEFKAAHPEIAKLLGGPQAIGKAIGEAGGKSGGGILGGIGDAVGGITQSIFGAPEHAAPSVGGGGIITFAPRTDVTVDVKTTGSPHEAGKEVADGVKRGMDGTDLQSSFAAIAGLGGF